MPGPLTARHLETLAAMCQKQEALVARVAEIHELMRDRDALQASTNVAADAWVIARANGEEQITPADQERFLALVARLNASNAEFQRLYYLRHPELSIQDG